MKDKASTLRELAEAKADGLTKTTIFKIDPTLIEFEEGFNVREEGEAKTDHINRLAEAMKAGAFIPPIDVRVEDGKILCVEGECRTRAALLVQVDVPEYLLQARQFTGNDTDRILHMLGTGNGQMPLNPLEQGIAFMRLERMGLDRSEIAKRRNISAMTVANNIALAEAPKRVQDMIRSGDVSATTARHVAKQGKEAIAALEKAVKANRDEQAKMEKELAEETNKEGDLPSFQLSADAVSGKKTKPKKAPKAKAEPKKKKVTAKKLKNTAAEKKPAKAKKSKTETPAPVAHPIPEGCIRVDLAKSDAVALVQVKSYLTDEPSLRALAVIETAILL